MRKIGVIVLLFILFSGTAFADSNWPPEIQTDIPVITFDAANFSGLTDTFQQSFKAIGSQGLRLLLIIGSVGVVAQGFKLILDNQTGLSKGLKQRQFNRKLDNLDMDRNAADIVKNKVKHMELNLLAKEKFRSDHPDADLSEALYRKKITAQANEIYFQKNYKKLVDEGVRNAELKHDVQGKIRQKHPNWEVDEAVHKMEVHIDAKRSYLKKHGRTYEEDNKNYYKRRKENEKNS